jgi:hypothetical protein
MICRELLVRYSLVKNSGKKGRGEQGPHITLGWSSDFSKFFGEPLGCVRPSAGSILELLRVYKMLCRFCQTPLKCIKGVLCKVGFKKGLRYVIIYLPT